MNYNKGYIILHHIKGDKKNIGYVFYQKILIISFSAKYIATILASTF